MLLIIGTFRLPPDMLALARPIMAEMARASRAEDGCSEYYYAEDVLEPGLIRVTELWRDRQALDQHFATEHLREWRAAWPALGIVDRSLRAYKVGDAEAV
ncbi:MAG: putative quinol monooxygenase [Novosphingobium sp.]